MSTKSKLIQQLTKLAGLQVTSRNLPVVGIDTLILAFEQPKPLFVEQSAEKQHALALLERSLPLLTETFAHLSGSLDTDRREMAQCCRSGLQYLIDEFQNDSSAYEKLLPILTLPAVQHVEEYMELSKDIPPEYPVAGNSEAYDAKLRENIPTSHTWWP